MRSPSASIAAVAILLLGAAASAAVVPAPPGTRTPHSSGDWGADEPALRGSAIGIFANLLRNAREGVDLDGKKVAYARLPDFVIDLNNVVIGGSPAAAFSAGIGMNSPGRFFKDSAAKVQAALNPIQQPMEDEADKYGRALAAKAGYPAEASVSSFLRAQDWL